MVVEVLTGVILVVQLTKMVVLVVVQVGQKQIMVLVHLGKVLMVVRVQALVMEVDKGLLVVVVVQVP